MMRRLVILACIFALAVMAGLAKAAIAPATSGEEGIADTKGAVLAGETPAETTQPEPVIPPAAPAPLASSEPAPTSANPLWAIPLSALTATRERPIFTASRRPPAAAVAPVAVVRAPPPPPPREPEKPRLALVGTIVADEDGFGIFIDQATRSALRLKLGEQHDGWTLRSVQSREVTLEKDQQTAVIAMPPPGKGSEGDAQSPAPARAVAVEQDRPVRRLH
jgi:hypothetical protein